MRSYADLPAGRKILHVFAAIVVIFVASFGVGIWSVGEVSRDGLRVGEHLAPLGDAAMEVKLNAAQAVVELERLIRGENGASRANVDARVADTRLYARAIVSGAETAEGRFIPTDSQEVRARMRIVGAEIGKFAEAVGRIGALIGTGQGVGSEADATFDGLYDDLVERVGRIAVTAPLHPVVQQLAGEARYRLAHGHLLVAEILGGDAGEDIAEATGSLAAADASLAGIAEQLPDAAEAIAAARADVARLIALAQERYAISRQRADQTARARSALFASYASFVRAADEAEELIHDDMAAGIGALGESLRIAYAAPMAGAAALALVLLSGYRRLERALGARLREVSQALSRLVAGDDRAQVPAWRSADEIGRLRDCVEEFQKLQQVRRKLEADVAARQEAAEQQRLIAEQRSAEADRLRQDAEAGRAEADAAKATAEATARDGAVFADALARVAEQATAGRFDTRIDHRFGDGGYARLSASVNALIHGIESGLGETKRVVSCLAAGDLSQRMNGEFQGTFRELQQGLNRTVDRMQHIVGGIRETGEFIASNAVQLSEGATDLARRTASQADSLQSTTASINDLNAAFRQNAARTETIAEGARSAAAEAEHGGAIVAQAMEAMRRIDKDSAQVKAIVDLIDDISFQTNLLSLNAGVEAARAGAAGRGFAVVAQEVGSLAQRAAQAADEIGKLVDRSSRGVDEGVKLVHAAGESLSVIVESIRGVAAATEEMTRSGRDQADSVGQIATVVAEIDRITQQNASMADGSVRSVAMLGDRADELLRQIRFFSLGPRGGGRERAPRRVA